MSFSGVCVLCFVPQEYLTPDCLPAVFFQFSGCVRGGAGVEM